MIERLLQDKPEDRWGARSYADLKGHPFFKSIDFGKLNTTVPPTLAPYPDRLVWQEDIIREEQERLEREHKELQEKWSGSISRNFSEVWLTSFFRVAFLHPNENILEHGRIIKKRKMTRKARVLFLTDTPRIFYVDPKKNEFKGEIPWDSGDKLKVDAKTSQLWRILTVCTILRLQ